MARKKITLSAAALLAAIAGGVGTAILPAPQVVAQTSPTAPRPDWPHFMPSRHIEGHIAFLKAELKITGAQDALWERVAAAMREDVKDFDQALEQLRANGQEPQTAVQSLEARLRLVALREKGEEQFLAAFRPLYESLSDAQRKTADELLASRSHAWNR